MMWFLILALILWSAALAFGLAVLAWAEGRRDR